MQRTRLLIPRASKLEIILLNNVSFLRDAHIQIVGNFLSNIQSGVNFGISTFTFLIYVLSPLLTVTTLAYVYIILSPLYCKCLPIGLPASSLSLFQSILYLGVKVIFLKQRPDLVVSYSTKSSVSPTPNSVPSYQWSYTLRMLSILTLPLT